MRHATEIVDARVKTLFGAYVHLGDARLNLGSAKNHLDGFLSLDSDPRTDADVIHDLEVTPLPFDDDTFDTILGSHVFEHVRAFVPLIADCYRILKPGGHLLAVTPHCGSDDAWDCPHHVRAFSEQTWHYLSSAIYDRDSLAHAGYGAYQGGTYAPWIIVRVDLVPYPEYQPLAQDDPEAFRRVIQRRYRNVIQEVHAVLRKP